MKNTQSLLSIRIRDMLFACNLIDSMCGYSYRFDLSTSIGELKIMIYHRAEGESVNRIVHRATLNLDDADVMEDFKELEIKLYEIATKKANTVSADY